MGAGRILQYFHRSEDQAVQKEVESSLNKANQDGRLQAQAELLQRKGLIKIQGWLHYTIDFSP